MQAWGLEWQKEKRANGECGERVAQNAAEAEDRGEGGRERENGSRAPKLRTQNGNRHSRMAKGGA